jgi:ATP-dependent exoDNAse (exonuclease V) beta subunit
MILEDLAVRQTALDPSRSFLVRAPAGSGKTTVLIRRFLRLLGVAEHPEEIVAVTFTRKAAQEMRDRVTEALLTAKSGVPPIEQVDRDTYELAVIALENDQRRGWDLIRHPSRLRVLTIDALCRNIVRQMPMMSGMAGLTTIEDNFSRSRLYKQAARSACEEIGATDMNSTVVKALAYFDNDWGKLEGLIAEMLPKRDQWLSFVTKTQDRIAFKKGYSEFVSSKLALISDQLDESTKSEMLSLVKYAAGNLQDSYLSQIKSFPTHKQADLRQWQTMLELFMTKAGALRKSANIKIGFPTKHPQDAKQMKERWTHVVNTLVTQASPLREILALPLDVYGEKDWEITDSLVKLLLVAAAHFIVLSDRTGRTDFTAFSMAALDALGDEDKPTDLALSLDYQINHLLIDEFQDTSVTQFELVRRLIAGWMDGGQKSIFLVGDPMQSIYRFRQSEVGLFKQVADAGFIGNMSVELLSLSVNFRSQGSLVHWVNTIIPLIVREAGQSENYFEAQKASRVESGNPFSFYPFFEKSEKNEADQVVKIITSIREHSPGASIAILVRSRAHLKQISSQLISAKISVSNRELELLESRPVIKDLTSLTNALKHLGDRMAWLALLRAPWAGLSLQTLHQLSVMCSTFLDALGLSVEQNLVSGEQGNRVARLCSIFNLAMAESAEKPFSRVVQECWLALGGPSIFRGEQSLSDAKKFFTILARLEAEGILLTPQRLRSAVAHHYSEGKAHIHGDSIEVMTMHQAKGLEFEHVIIPGLGSGVRPGTKPLLHWQQNYGESNLPTLLLAPIGAPNTENKLYDYLHYSDSRAKQAELARLLYVVLTRAKTKVYLLGHANKDKKNQVWKPSAGSLLALLWPTLGPVFDESAEKKWISAVEIQDRAQEDRNLRVVRAVPETLPDYNQYYKAINPRHDESIEFDWASDLAKQIGTVIHRMLELLSKNMLRRRSLDRLIEAAEPFAKNQLKSLGVANNDLVFAVKSVMKALETSLFSERGSWIFSEDHILADSELVLSCELADGSLQTAVLDRTFIDSAGVRWIIDYKTGAHSGGGLSEYLDSEEQRYKSKLNHYANIMHNINPGPIKLGLYFPLLDAWRQWDYQENA